MGPQPPLAFMFSSLWDAMLIRAETAGQSLRIRGKKGCMGGGQKEREREKRKEKRGRERGGAEKEGERFLRGKGEDVDSLKEDAARRSQLSHLVVNP